MSIYRNAIGCGFQRHCNCKALTIYNNKIFKKLINKKNT